MQVRVTSNRVRKCNPWNPSFISGLKFLDEHGVSMCTVWYPVPTGCHWESREFNLSHPGYRLSHLSGYEDSWLGDADHSDIVNGITFFWIMESESRDELSLPSISLA